MIAMRTAERRSRRLVVALLSLSLVVCPSAFGQPVSDSARAAARKLGDEAGALFAAGDYAAALEKYERADALVHVPTLGVRAARCLEKLGRLVEAAERYLAVTRMEVKRDAPKVHREALSQAEAERAALLPRIPAVTIEVEGGTDGVEALLDGKSMPLALISVEQPLDPGAHKLELKRGGTTEEQTFSLSEGEKKRVSIAAPAAPSAPLSAPSSSATVTESDTGTRQGGATQRTLAYVALGVGAAGVLVGSVTGVLALVKKGDLDDACPDRSCPPAKWDDADSYDSLRTYSTVGFAVGVIGAGAGALLLLSAPKAPPAEQARRSKRPVTVWVAPGVYGGAGGVRGVF